MTLACAPLAELGIEEEVGKCFMVRWANHNHLLALRPQNVFYASASSGTFMHAWTEVVLIVEHFARHWSQCLVQKNFKRFNTINFFPAVDSMLIGNPYYILSWFELEVLGNLLLRSHNRCIWNWN